MKVKRDKDRNIIAYSYYGYNFCCYSDAYLFRSFLLAHNPYAPNESKKISKGYYLIGVPDFVNVGESISKLKIIYYKDSEIDWGD